VNCCDPVDVAPAIATAREVTGKPVFVYPNSGEGWDAAARRWTGWSRFPAADAAQWVARWVALGAAGVGGCCRVGPAEIAAVARVLQGAGGGAGGCAAGSNCPHDQLS
jgi:homocysteine S-methyltransferase